MVGSRVFGFQLLLRKRVSDVDVVAGDTDVGFIFNGHLGRSPATFGLLFL